MSDEWKSKHHVFIYTGLLKLLVFIHPVQLKKIILTLVLSVVVDMFNDQKVGALCYVELNMSAVIVSNHYERLARVKS